MTKEQMDDLAERFTACQQSAEIIWTQLGQYVELVQSLIPETERDRVISRFLLTGERDTQLWNTLQNTAGSLQGILSSISAIQWGIDALTEKLEEDGSNVRETLEDALQEAEEQNGVVSPEEGVNSIQDVVEQTIQDIKGDE